MPTTEAALNEAAVVRNALNGPATARALGQAHTMASLERGAVRELLLTPRFIEMNPGTAIALSLSCQRSAGAVTLVHGAAALHLDLIAEGIGAVLATPPRRAFSPRGDRPRRRPSPRETN